MDTDRPQLKIFALLFSLVVFTYPVVSEGWYKVQPSDSGISGINSTNSQKLNGTKLSNIDWDDVAMAEGDVTPSNIGLGSVENITQSGMAGDQLSWDSTDNEIDLNGSLYSDRDALDAVGSNITGYESTTVTYNDTGGTITVNSTDTNASTECSGTDTYLAGDGTCQQDDSGSDDQGLPSVLDNNASADQSIDLNNYGINNTDYVQGLSGQNIRFEADQISLRNTSKKDVLRAKYVGDVEIPNGNLEIADGLRYGSDGLRIADSADSARSWMPNNDGQVYITSNQDLGSGGFQYRTYSDSNGYNTRAKFYSDGDLKIEGSFTEGASLDFAENMPVKPKQESKVEPGDVVGIKDGEVTRNTSDAALNMVVSAAPGITLGGSGLNLDEEEKREFSNSYKAIAFTGQVPVKVKGEASEGDYLIPSGKSDGTAVAVSDEEVSFAQYRDAVGIVLGEFEIPGNVNEQTREKYRELLDKAENEEYKVYNVAVGVK